MSLRCTLYTSTTGQKGIHDTDLKPELSASVPQPLRLRRSGRYAVATHDFRQSCSVWRATGGRVDHRGALAEILRT
jgi:hypothetical protein